MQGRGPASELLLSSSNPLSRNNDLSVAVGCVLWPALPLLALCFGSRPTPYLACYNLPLLLSRRKIVPTVNAGSSASVEKMLSHFLELMDLSSDRKRLDSYFCKRDSPATPTARGSGDWSTPGAAGRGPSALSAPAEKRRRGTTCVAAGPTRSPAAGKIPDPPPPSAARERIFSENGRSLGTPHRRQSLSTLTRHNSGSATRGKANASRPLGGRVENPYAAAVAGHRPAVASPDAAAGSRSIDVDEPAVVAAPAAWSGAVELDRVDVEAQKAIMADIERRKREQQQQQQQGQGRTRAGEKPDREADSARSGDSGRGDPAEERLRVDVSGQEPSRPSVKRDDSNRPEAGTIGAEPRGVSGGSGVSCKAGRLKAAEQPMVGCDGRSPVLLIDDESDESTANSPMDIRDFFSPRGKE